MIRITGILLLLVVNLIACRNQTASSSNTPSSPELTASVSEEALPDGFLDFYDRFHRDSLYQIEHIAWPLQGDKSIRVGSDRMEKRPATWTQTDWRIHRPVDFSTGEFKRQWEVLGDALVIERISYAAANYGLERRFVKQYNDEWELVFYSDMQEINK